jgi:phosphatidylserine/phosphatidylglycerophosphate/cardiolipin synthase-like enzyme
VVVSNPRWLIDGTPVTSFVYGRKAQLAVDVRDTPATEIVFKLQKTTLAPPLSTQVRTLPAVGSTPQTVTVPVTLAHQWPVLEKLPTTYSHFNVCCDAGATQPYQTNAWYLADQVSDDLLFPPLKFSAAESGQAPITSPVIKRAMPQFIPGNQATLLVDGDQIQTSVLAAIAAAQHHIHLDWFFFDTKAKISVALQAAARRGVEVRLLFDQLATATPEPLGQGIKPGAFVEGLEDLEDAGVRVGASSLLVPPLDNLRTVTDAEYRDRLDVQKEYVARLMMVHGSLIATKILTSATPASVYGRLPGFIRQLYSDASDLGSAGLGTPVLLAGCRDHTKLIVVDGAVAFCGGANAQRYYLYDNPISPGRDATEEMNDPATTEKWQKWHDCFIRYAGPAAREAQRYFVERWAVCTGEYLSRTSSAYFPPTAGAGSASIKVVNNIPGLERDIAGEYLRMFRNSTTRIQVENPYVTDDLIANYLAHAAQIRNVPVDLLVPEKYLDFGIARDLMKARWDSLRAADIALYAYNNHMLHVKVATADARTSIVSSYNFAKSSAAQLFEHGVVVDDPAFAAEVEQKLFDVDRPVSVLVNTSAAPNWKTVANGPMRFLDRIV